MRGIKVDAQRLSQIRKARGLTQRELAVAAGVGERTVRNAEAGRRVRLDFLKYLATALGVEVLDVVLDNDELQISLQEQQRVGHILAAIDCFAGEGDLSEFIGLGAPNIFLNMPGAPHVPFAGEYRGADGLRTLEDRNREFLLRERPPEILDIRASGKLVVLSGQDWFSAIPTGKSFSTWWQQIYEFDEGRIVRVDVLGDTALAASAFRPG